MQDLQSGCQQLPNSRWHLHFLLMHPLLFLYCQYCLYRSHYLRFLYYLYYKSGRSGPEASWMKASISRVQHLSLW